MTRSTVRPPRRASWAAGAAVLLLSTAACSGGGDEPTPEGTPSDGGGSRTDAPIPVEPDGLPADFPRDEVPVVDGEIVSVQSPTAKDSTFDLLIYVGDTPRLMTVQQAVAQLEDAGWTLKTTIAGEEPAAQVLTKKGGAARQVILTNTAQRNESALTYTIDVVG